MLAVLLRPFARAFVTRVQAELDHVARPADAPRHHTAGSDPDRVLIFGNGPVNGFGVRTQDLALPGQVGRLLAGATGRGCDIDLVARRRTSVELAPGLVADLRPARYDGLVVVIGATDAAAFLPVRRWRRAMSALLDELVRTSAPGSPIVVVGIYNLRRSSLTMGVLGDLVDEHARRLNAVTRALCAADPRLIYLERDDGRLDGVTYQSAQAFELLGSSIAAALIPGLDAVAADRSGRSSRTVRARPEPESERQAAVEALGLLDTPAEERFDRIVRTARSSLGTAFAAVSLLDGDRQWYKSVSGPVGGAEALPQELDRGSAICDRTIRSDQPLVLSDLASDDYPDLVAAGYRFYAGVPIESPDGYRVGALCVLDTEPRRLEDVDTALLRELALRVQRELWTLRDGSLRQLTPAR